MRWWRCTGTDWPATGGDALATGGDAPCTATQDPRQATKAAMDFVVRVTTSLVANTCNCCLARKREMGRGGGLGICALAPSCSLIRPMQAAAKATSVVTARVIKGTRTAAPAAAPGGHLPGMTRHPVVAPNQRSTGGQRNREPHNLVEVD
jgi:hypothetical protein